ncbi:unnamed protein product [Colias eurytheme]|nr:unnamed protein product [Colias eurytheme]
MNFVQDGSPNKRYRKKYNNMKLKVKSLIIENAALCDEVAKIQENIQIVKDERKFLLRKLLEYENDIDVSQTYYRNEPTIIPTNGSKTKPKKRRSHEDSGKSIPP